MACHYEDKFAFGGPSVEGHYANKLKYFLTAHFYRGGGADDGAFADFHLLLYALEEARGDEEAYLYMTRHRAGML